jgi:chromosome segregation ATPase
MELKRLNLNNKPILEADEKLVDAGQKSSDNNNNNNNQPKFPARKEEESIATSKQINDLLMSVEKINGKLEIGSGAREAINERVTDLSSRIGELNQMVMGREKKLDRYEMEFEKIKDSFHDIKPERIQKKFEEKEKDIAQINLSIEKINVNLQILTKTLKAYQNLMQKIKSFENLFQILQQVDQKLTAIKESKRYIDQKTSKVEVLFTEINKKMHQIGNHDQKIEYLENLVQDLVKSVDKANVKLEHSVTKNDLEKEVNNFNKELSVLTEGMRELKNHSQVNKTKKLQNNNPKENNLFTEKNKKISDLKETKLFADKHDEDSLRLFVKSFLKKGKKDELYQQLLSNGWKKEQVDYILNNQ